MVVHRYRAGERIGEYRVLRELGSGSTGYVYLGQHTYLEFQNAIKVFHSLASDESHPVFTRGLRAIVQMVHPNLVRILHAGIVDGHPYLVMGYMPGGSMRDRCPPENHLSLHPLAHY